MISHKKRFSWSSLFFVLHILNKSTSRRDKPVLAEKTHSLNDIVCDVDLPNIGKFPYPGNFPYTGFIQGFIHDLRLGLPYPENIHILENLHILSKLQYKCLHICLKAIIIRSRNYPIKIIPGA